MYLHKFLCLAPARQPGMDHPDATLPLLEALRHCPDGDTLFLGGGEWHFYPTEAWRGFFAISNNDSGFKSIAFPLIGRRDLCIDGEGARLIFHGKMMPFVISGCQNITVRRLSVDYAEPMYFQGEILDADENFVEMAYDDTCFHVEPAKDCLRFYGKGWENRAEKVLVNEFDPAEKAPTPYTATYRACFSNRRDPTFMASLDRFVKASKPLPNRLRLEGSLQFRHTPGMYWLCTHNDRTCPGFFIENSSHILLEDIDLHHTLSMGVIAQMTDTITLCRLNTIPSPGRLLSTDADATHFVNCSGLIRLSHCRFESMMDDTGNFHGIYMPVVRRADDHHLILRFGHFQQKGVHIFRTGDTVRLSDPHTLEPFLTTSVADSTLLSDSLVLLETTGELPDNIQPGQVVDNTTRIPDIHIEHCTTGRNRPRGFLISTARQALVENCTFSNMNAAIDLEGDALTWFECGSCRNLIVRHNRFTNAAYAGGPVIVSHVESTPGSAPYHGHLTIEDNLFEMHEKRFVGIRSCESLTFRNNTYLENPHLPAHPPVGETGFYVADCPIQTIEPPKKP